MSLKLEKLMLAMTEHEGWQTPKEASATLGSRSYRNHNPGNLRASPFQSGQLDGFAFFKSDAVGYFAFYWDIQQKAKGNTSTGLNGESTLRQFIAKWAPSSDGNNTEAYLQAIVKNSGLPETTKLKEFLE